MRSEYPLSFSYAIYFCIFIFGMQLTMLGPLLATMAETFERPLALMGVLFTLSSAGFMIAIVGGGILADRIGKKRVIAVASMGFGICLLLFAASDWFLASAALVFLIGGFGGVLESLLSALVATIQQGKERAAVTLTQVFFGVGAIAGPAFAGWIVQSGISWKYAYAAVGVLAFLSAVWLHCYRYPTVKPEERIVSGDIALILRNRKFLLLCSALAIYVGVEMAVNAWTAHYFTATFRFSGGAAGYVVSIFWVVITFGRLFFSWLSLKLSNRVLIRGLALLAATGFVLQSISYSSAAAIASVIVIGIGLSAIWPLVVAEAGTLFSSKSSGTSFGIVISAGGIGGAVIPVVVGYLSESVSMRLLFVVFALLMAVIVLIHHFASRPFAETVAEPQNFTS